MPERIAYATARTRSLIEVVCLSACHQQGMSRSHGYRLLMACTEACGPQSSRGLYLYLYLYLYLSTSTFISIYLSIFLSIYLSIFLSVYLSIYLSIHTCICVNIHTYMCIYIHNCRNGYGEDSWPAYLSSLPRAQRHQPFTFLSSLLPVCVCVRVVYVHMQIYVCIYT